MLRRWTALVGIALSIPTLAAAQADQPPPGSVRILPFVGHHFGFGRFDYAIDFSPYSSTGGTTVRDEHSGGVTAGLAFALPVGSSAFDVVVDLAWYQKEDVQRTISPEGGADRAQSDAISALSASLGLAYRLPIGFPLQISVAPAALRIASERQDGAGPPGDLAHNTWAISFGASSVYPISEWVGVSAGVQDLVVAWKRQDFGDRIYPLASRTPQTTMADRVVHLPVVRIGLSLLQAPF